MASFGSRPHGMMGVVRVAAPRATGKAMITGMFATVIAVHALIHLLGTAKGFGWAEIPQLTQAGKSVV